MPLRTLAYVLAVGLAIGVVAASVPAGGPDRLERFRQLAASQLSGADPAGSDSGAEVVRELYALLDDEIVESLEAGGPFASQGFLQDRLDAFTEAWGGSRFWILTLPQANLTVGSFQLSPAPSGNSVRVYRRAGSRAELLTAIHREGSPELSPFPPTRLGQGQFLVVWVGPPSPGGTPAIRIELWRQDGERVRVVWSTADLFGPELYASAYSLRGAELVVRYEPRYPGWKPGCEGQTEQEDHYRYVPASETFVLARRHVHNGWHRELHTVVDRLLAALGSDDQRTLSALGLSPELRRRLPAGLEREPACDMRDGATSPIATVSAIAPGDPRPWALRFRHTRDGWRLDGAERLR